MTQNRTRAPKAPQESPPVDPLADLRDTSGDDGLPPLQDDQGEALEAEQDDTGPGVRPIPLVSQEDQDAARDLIILAWHNDTVAHGFVHNGGACGCRYLAGVALRAVMPAAPEDETED